MAILSSLGKHRDLGILFIRIGLGITFMMHGYPKLAGGASAWESLGGSMQAFGIDFFPTGWGLMAALSEFLGGLLLALGLLYRPAVLFLLATMIIASFVHLSNGDGFKGASHAIELAIVLFGLLFIGPGKYSMDKN